LLYIVILIYTKTIKNKKQETRNNKKQETNKNTKLQKIDFGIIIYEDS